KRNIQAFVCRSGNGEAGNLQSVFLKNTAERIQRQRLLSFFGKKNFVIVPSVNNLVFEHINTAAEAYDKYHNRRKKSEPQVQHGHQIFKKGFFLSSFAKKSL